MRTSKLALLLALLLASTWLPLACDDGGGSGQADQLDATGDSVADDGVAGDTSTAADTSSVDSGTADDTPRLDVPSTPVLGGLLSGLRNGVQRAMQTQSEADGWPAAVEGGLLFVSTDPTLDKLAGEHEGWVGTPMTVEAGFAWIVVEVAAGTRYKFTDGTRWEADPWSRAYEWDQFGLMSRVPPTEAHLERFFNVSDPVMPPRMVHVWVPAESPTHVLYVHDGQNLFDPNAMFGGWHLSEAAPAAMLLVGIDNTGMGRMDEYTHVVDDIDGSGPIGGQGDAYAAFVQQTVRALVRAQYGEPPVVGTMGSSLGGLIAFHIADRYPGEYEFAASLSGTMGWGSIGMHEETMIERYAARGHRDTALYLDSGGNVVGDCADLDGDGIEDDADASDNYCENRQLEQTLYGLGYTANVDVWHWWEPDAPHNEAAWAARVFRPLDLFAGL